MRRFIAIIAMTTCFAVCKAADPDYKKSEEYQTLRSEMTHAFNDGDSLRFFTAVKNLEEYLLKQDDLHAYYTQRCNEIVFLMNRQKIFEAYKLARQLSKELREKKLDKEMYMAVNMMGHINRYCGNNETAKQCFREVIAMMEKEGYRESMPPIYMNIVNVEMSDNPEEALELLNKAAEIAAETSPERVFDIETRRTLSYYNMGDMEKFLEGYAAYKKGVEQGLSSVHGHTIEVYYQASQGNVDRAVELAQESLGDESGEIITNVYAKAGRWKEAYEWLRKETTANDSIANVVLSNSMAGIEDEIKLYEAERTVTRNRIITLVSISCLLVLLVIALVYIVLSRRRHMKELQSAYQHALESDKMKTAFIQNVSHEVRTPLNIIGGFAQVIADPDMDAGPEERQVIADTVTRSTRTITSMIDEMLVLSLNDTTGRVDANDLVSVNSLLRDACRDVEDILNGDTKLLVDSALSDDYTLTTSEDMLKHIVGALLDNAAKNTSEGSIILRASAADGQLSVTVEDTGSGIPAAEAERIFERFVKLDTFKEGIGLGLPLARTLATKLGGTVNLDTAYTAGARFIVTLPINQ